MAKSRIIRVPDGQDNPPSIDTAVLSPQEPTGSLGAIADSILEASDDPLICVASIRGRSVAAIATAGLPDLASLDAVVTALTRLARFTKDDQAKSSKWSNTNAHAATLSVNNLTTTEQVATMAGKPSLSVSTLISRIEDACGEGGSMAGLHAKEIMVVVNQRDQHVSVYQHDDVDEIHFNEIGREPNSLLDHIDVPAEWLIIYQQADPASVIDPADQWGE